MRYHPIRRSLIALCLALSLPVLAPQLTRLEAAQAAQGRATAEEYALLAQLLSMDVRFYLAPIDIEYVREKVLELKKFDLLANSKDPSIRGLGQETKEMYARLERIYLTVKGDSLEGVIAELFLNALAREQNRRDNMTLEKYQREAWQKLLPTTVALAGKETTRKEALLKWTSVRGGTPGFTIQASEATALTNVTLALKVTDVWGEAVDCYYHAPRLTAEETRIPLPTRLEHIDVASVTYTLYANELRQSNRAVDFPDNVRMAAQRLLAVAKGAENRKEVVLALKSARAVVRLAPKSAEKEAADEIVERLAPQLDEMEKRLEAMRLAVSEERVYVGQFWNRSAKCRVGIRFEQQRDQKLVAYLFDPRIDPKKPQREKTLWGSLSVDPKSGVPQFRFKAVRNSGLNIRPVPNTVDSLIRVGDDREYTFDLKDGKLDGTDSYQDRLNLSPKK